MMVLFLYANYVQNIEVGTLNTRDEDLSSFLMKRINSHN